MIQKDLIIQSGNLLTWMQERGFDIEIEDDFEAIEAWSRAHGRGAKNPKIAITRNDFTRGEAFWVFISKNGERFGTLAARCFDLNGEPLDEYLRRTSNAQFGNGEDVVEYVAPTVSQLMGGKMVFFGDLMIDEGARGSNRVLAAYSRLTMVCAALTWPDFDWMYAFVTRQHMKLADMYGFTYRLPRVVKWREPIPEGRDDTHVLVAISSSDFRHLLATGEMSEF